MNKDTFVVSHYYDREEARIEEWDAEIEEAKKDYYNKGRESGLIEGREENRREMIVNLYKNNASLELISASTGLSIEEIERIINEEQDN